MSFLAADIVGPFPKGGCLSVASLFLGPFLSLMRTRRSESILSKDLFCSEISSKWNASFRFFFLQIVRLSPFSHSQCDLKILYDNSCTVRGLTRTDLLKRGPSFLIDSHPLQCDRVSAISRCPFNVSLETLSWRHLECSNNCLTGFELLKFTPTLCLLQSTSNKSA